MFLSRSAVSLLLLGLAAPAAAGNGRPVHTIQDSFSPGQTRRDAPRKTVDTHCDGEVCTVRATFGDGVITQVKATLSSDGGEETVALVETDTRLHGSAAFAALPKESAALVLTAYDTRSAVLTTFSGRLGADGSITLAPETCSARAGCVTDIELVSAEVYAAAKGYEVALDFGGADAFDIAYASLSYTPPCSTAERTCTSGKPVTAEVYWDDISTVWEGALSVAHEGVIDARVQALDAKGATVENTRVAIGTPWEDGGDGAGVLAFDGDALTTIGLIRGREGARIKNVRSLAVVSDGWDADDALPAFAEIETDGGTVVIPADSYQRRAPPDFMVEDFRFGVKGAASFRLRLNGSSVSINGGNLSLADISAPLCVEGTCVRVDPDGGFLSVSQYHWDTAFPADSVKVELDALDAGGKVVGTHVFPAKFDQQISVVFAAEAAFSGDPVGTAFTGRVDLLDAGGRSLTHGRFYGALGIDSAGELGVGGAGVDDVAAVDTNFAVLLTGAPSSCGDDEDGFTTVPPLMATFGNGSGTKNASSTVSAKPQLL